MNTTTILIVEDEKIIAKGIEKRLRGMGYLVAGSASTAEEAIQKATELRPDLVLMDIHLGNGMDGVEAADRMRRRLNLPVVYLTAHSDEATLQRAKLTEPFGYVLKPYEDRDLQTAIEIGLYKHKMEQRLRENEQWLAATLASIGDSVIATDDGGRVRFMNSLAEQLTGWTQNDAFGTDVREVFQIVEEKNRRPVTNPAFEALARGEPVGLAPNAILIDRAGGERPIDDSAAPIRDVSGKVAGAVLVFRDISERRRLEDHLRQAQKMEAIGRLAGGIAHDFNNIMAVITGCSELLLRDSPPAAQRLDLARTIHDAGMRAASLTQQIMAFSRKQMLVPCVLNLNTVIRDMGTMVKRLIGSHIEFLTEPAPDLGQVKADPTQIGQVILNLAANARDAMPHGGRLVIATANAELDEATTRKHADVKAGRYARLSISDTGSGMPDDVLAHAFEPFFTTKEVGQGTGLGLATVYGIVKQSGGHIEVTSEIGAGTTFKVYLPLIGEPPTPTLRETRSPVRGHETILLVEDDDPVRLMTRTILQQSGYTVLEASNGLMAVQVIEGHPATIDLLITDLVMPQLSGRQVAERLTSRLPGLRVLFMSGYTEDLIVQQGVESATADFIHKPFSLAALTNKVREVLDREKPG
jgi:PAS domain S-box-containing protein